jgi:prepilin-type N-terminal cleavage/methylation domain-containing protein
MSGSIGRRADRGFSIIELLIVIFIIVVVVAIVVPALGGARRLARDASSRTVVSSLSQACSQFILDNRRAPGYFTATEMGRDSNLTRGFTAMQNAMLDLAGGVVTTAGAGVVTAGPGTSPQTQVLVNPSLIGTATGGGKRYFAPDAKYFKVQDGSEGGDKVADAANKAIPDLIDANGNPILLWVADAVASRPVAAVDDFARETSGPAANPTLARFYAASNNAFLAGTAVGRMRKDQASGSLMGANFANRFDSMAAILGSPSAPVNPAATLAAMLPAQPRGSFVIQAPGGDGMFLSREGQGGRILDGGILRYGATFRVVGSGAALTDDTGKPTSLDLTTQFDDIFVSGQ